MAILIIIIIISLAFGLALPVFKMIFGDLTNYISYNSSTIWKGCGCMFIVLLVILLLAVII
jgi:hypothetical protein